MDYKTIAYEVDERVATITLDRERALNAYTNRMQEELVDAFDQTDADDRVRAVIVTGRGRAFCAGADLSGGDGTFDYTERVREEGNGIETIPRDTGGLVALRIFRSLKPVIGAINGVAVGVGVTMTLPMDVRLASQTARFGFVFTRRGIVPEACSSWFLPRLVGISRAAEWVYTGRVFGADEALAHGLVRSLHSPDDLLPAANALAAEMSASTSSVSVALSRQLLWRMLTASHPMEAHRADSRGVWLMGRGPDAREGVNSFLEKRPAVFPGLVSDDLPSVFPEWEEPPFR